MIASVIILIIIAIFRSIIIEVPHFASLRGKEREIQLLRSDNGEHWYEHPLVASEDVVQQTISMSFEGQWDESFVGQ